jgi:Tfp pilus assembly protein PilX
MIKKTNKKRGSILYFSLLVLTITSLVVLGLSSITILQIRMSRGMKNSAVAFYASDSGVEEALFQIKSYNIYSPISGAIPFNSESSTYNVIVEQGISCGIGISYCIKSTGSYGGPTRIIEFEKDE